MTGGRLSSETCPRASVAPSTQPLQEVFFHEKKRKKKRKKEKKKKKKGKKNPKANNTRFKRAKFCKPLALTITSRLSGTRIVYDRNALLMMRNSPLAKTPTNLPPIPGVTTDEPEKPKHVASSPFALRSKFSFSAGPKETSASSQGRKESGR
jgi:hypothetical protein